MWPWFQTTCVTLAFDLLNWKWSITHWHLMGYICAKYKANWLNRHRAMELTQLTLACPFQTLVVLYRMFPFIICLILMNYLMEFYFIGFVNAHLPGCFCPWTFRLNIGLNTSPSDSFVSHLNSQLGYSAGEFQALQLIVLSVFGAVD